MKYLLIEWPESQYFMEDIESPYPNTCYWAQYSQNIFVPEHLYKEVYENLCNQ